MLDLEASRCMTHSLMICGISSGRMKYMTPDLLPVTNGTKDTQSVNPSTKTDLSVTSI